MNKLIIMAAAVLTLGTFAKDGGRMHEHGKSRERGGAHERGRMQAKGIPQLPIRRLWLWYSYLSINYTIYP